MHPVILAQTDTTVGFLSQDAEKLAKIKDRPSHKPFIQSFDSLRTYTQMGGRIPNRYKSRLRRSKSTTYVVNNQAIRIVNEGQHHQLLSNYGWLYSTSANEKGKSFEMGFSEKKADLVIEDDRGLFEGIASNIYKINSKKIRRLR